MLMNRSNTTRKYRRPLGRHPDVLSFSTLSGGRPPSEAVEIKVTALSLVGERVAIPPSWESRVKGNLQKKSTTLACWRRKWAPNSRLRNRYYAARSAFVSLLHNSRACWVGTRMGTKAGRR